MFDDEQQVMYNHSSILVDTKSTDDSKLHIKSFKEGHYDELVVQDVYDKIRVEV